MKTVFKISTNEVKQQGGIVEIIGEEPYFKPYLYFKVNNLNPLGYIEGKELRQLATNILKALDGKPRKRKK